MASTGITPDGLEHYRDDWHMFPGVVSGGLMFLTGMTGVRPDGSVAEDPEEQIREAFANVASVLREAGLEPSHIVEMTTYHVGIRDHIDVFRSVRDEHIGEARPAWTAIEVSGFITAGAIVEIRAVADASSAM